MESYYDNFKATNIVGLGFLSACSPMHFLKVWVTVFLVQHFLNKKVFFLLPNKSSCYLFQKETVLLLYSWEFNDKAGKTQIACDTNSRNCLLRSIMQRMLERNNASRRVYFCHLQMRLLVSPCYGISNRTLSKNSFWAEQMFKRGPMGNIGGKKVDF